MTREQSLTRRRAWTQAGHDMLARSFAAGHRAPPRQRLTPREFAEHAFAGLIAKSRKNAERRRGKRRPVSEVQSQHLAKRKAVTLPSLSFMGDKP